MDDANALTNVAGCCLLDLIGKPLRALPKEKAMRKNTLKTHSPIRHTYLISDVAIKSIDTVYAYRFSEYIYIYNLW